VPLLIVIDKDVGELMASVDQALSGVGEVLILADLIT
jgi:hypothetical protein